MEVIRKDEGKVNITRNGGIAKSNTGLSLSFSSDRFMFTETPDEEEIVDCINKSGHLFADFKRKPPTLEEALKSMEYGDEKSKELSYEFLGKAKGKLDEFEAPGLTPEDVSAIYCYTYEWDSKRFGDLESPYRKLNNSLSIDRSNAGLKKTRGFLFLLLVTLRKLPRYTPVNGVLYRGIRVHVQTEADPDFPRRKPYAAGNEKVWWTFTSTTEDLEATRIFIGESESTLFTISGKPWGYDISMFSDFPDEKEILLEPERKLKVTGVAREGNIIAVNAEMVKTPLVLEDLIKVKTVKIKEKNSKRKETPENLKAENSTETAVELSWSEPKGVKEDDILSYQVSVKKGGGNFFRWNVENLVVTRGKETNLTARNLEMGERYEFRVRCKFSDGWGSWGEKIKVAPFSWKECYDNVDGSRKYSVYEENPRIATFIGGDWCTIIGNTPLPPNKVTSWSIKVLESRNNNGGSIFIGVAPSDIDQNKSDNSDKCGWYFNCHDSRLRSGPPHNYNGKEYGPRKGNGQYVHKGDSVGVVMDIAKGKLSFIVGGINLGVAYEGFPLDKPLVPCVLLYHNGDSIELDTSEVKENMDSSIPLPSNITAKSTTWDSITLTWDAVEGASFYQIEVDGSILCDASTTNSFTKRGLLPETEHTFKVRVVRGNSVSEWSDVVKGKTQKKSFEYGWWKECPDNVVDNKKYSVDEENPRIATFIGGGRCTIIGNTPLPLNTVTSWNIKILKSKNNNGNDIFIGVAPSDIYQNKKGASGWYFNCYFSELCSGPPHNYYGKEYGPRKGEGQYVHTGDSAGVVMDTTKGELSFVVGGINLGVAYEGILLEKPLVPCVLLWKKGDTVELDTSEVKETALDNSIPVPSNTTAKSTTWDSITLTWDAIERASFYQIEMNGSKSWGASTTNTFTKIGLLAETDYTFRVRAVRGNTVSEWSDIVKGRTQKESFETSRWKECPDNADKSNKYSVDEKNPRIVTKVNNTLFSRDKWCTIIGNTFLPLNKVTSWSIKVLKSRNNGIGICIGVAPSDINQDVDDNYKECGWYLDCYGSTLYSGPPHNYRGKEYGPRKGDGQYVHTGDSVGVVMDTTKGELSFVLSGVNLGVAYERIPLDKPLVPCVILVNRGDSVELNTSEVKETVVNSSISVPSNITSKSLTWDSISLTWDAVEGASFYQNEVDGKISWDASTTNSFTKRGLLPDTDYTFRVRTVKGNSVSEWSDIVKVKTVKESFEASWWKECPDDVDGNRKYSVDVKNPRIATNIGYDDILNRSTIIGNTPLPPNKVISWSIKILKSRDNDGGCIYIGIAPSNINQNTDNRNKCGWYIDCYYSTLRSGPPHNYWDKEYGPRKDKGEYVHTGDSVGVVMDTTKGELSFVLDGVNLGVAYEGIPLNKPLVPCVILEKKGDSVELDTSEVKENVVDSSIRVPSNITTESITWDSITLTWDAVEGASFYQIEVDGCKSWGASTTNTFTKRGVLLPETEHTFRVRVVKKNSVSVWSDVVKGRTQKAPEFSECKWKECPDDVDKSNKYSVDKKNSKNVMMIGCNGGRCTVIGNTPLPPNRVTSWNIKILKSRDNDGLCLWIGVAPSGINQNKYDNSLKCGWYFYCYYSTLHSGPPYTYWDKLYGPRKNNGEYVHTGDNIGIVMDTTKGEISFVLNGVNHGVAYEGIPLDKPLVPCVILGYEDDSVELVI